MSKKQTESELMKVLDDAGMYTFTVYDEDNNYLESFDDLNEVTKYAAKWAKENMRRCFIYAVILAFVPTGEVKIIK